MLLRADGVATYQLANPLDDVHHGMTHVIRGDDLLSSTPRQKLLLEALGHTYPVTAHLPQILGADKKRLSKRHGAASVEEFRDAGYVPEAVVNYLALVGWSYDDSTELMTVEELIERFTIDRVSASPGVFDHQKLAWMNGVYLRGLSPDDYAARLRATSPTAARRSPSGDELADARAAGAGEDRDARRVRGVRRFPVPPGGVRRRRLAEGGGAARGGRRSCAPPRRRSRPRPASARPTSSSRCAAWPSSSS